MVRSGEVRSASTTLSVFTVQRLPQRDRSAELELLVRADDAQPAPLAQVDVSTARSIDTFRTARQEIYQDANSRTVASRDSAALGAGTPRASARHTSTTESTMSNQSFTHFKIDRRSSRYLRVTFDHPPIN